MAKRKGGEADGQGFAARRPVIIAAWLGILLATLAGGGVWALVARGVTARASPGRVIDSPALAPTLTGCSSIAVVEGEMVWTECGDSFVRIDSAKAKVQSWPIADDDDFIHSNGGVFHGFFPDAHGPVVLMGGAILRLLTDGTVSRIGRDQVFEQALGLWAGPDDVVEVVAPNAWSTRGSVSVHRFSHGRRVTEAQQVKWRLHPEYGALEVIGAQRDTEWRFHYAAGAGSPVFVGTEDENGSLGELEAVSHRRPDAAYVYLDSPSWTFPKEFRGRVEYRVSYIRLTKKGVMDWDIGGRDFARADMMVTPDGLMPLVELTNEKKGAIRHGRLLRYVRDVDSALLAGWDGEDLQRVASNWPNTRTVVVPLADGGIAFVDLSGHIARVDGSMQRTDRVFALERLYKALRSSALRDRWGAWFLLFTWPAVAACAALIASLAQRRRVYVIGLAGALWFIGALIAFEQTGFLVFANSL